MPWNPEVPGIQWRLGRLRRTIMPWKLRVSYGAADSLWCRGDCGVLDSYIASGPMMLPQELVLTRDLVERGGHMMPCGGAFGPCGAA